MLNTVGLLEAFVGALEAEQLVGILEVATQSDLSYKNQIIAPIVGYSHLF